jgi:Flp pilus assembly protein TadG
MYQRQPTRRRGTTTVEFAIVLPIALFFILAILVGGVGVMRYQQVASMAREGARWASVRGGDYQRETKQPAATPEDIFNSAIAPFAGTMDPERLSYEVSWNANNMPRSVTNDYVAPIGNVVTVTVRYQWMPAVLLVGPIELKSTSSAEMLY